MIIWIASFPRSGNSLLRHILFNTMSQLSYHEPHEAEPDPEVYAQHIGPSHEDFYAWATEVTDPVFVKTHALPSDDHAAIYVVRDGRVALTSFLRHERHFSPDAETNSLLRLILGDHYFGSWSDHFRAWRAREARTLMLNYRELFNADGRMLSDIAAFIGHEGAVGAWDNPIDELRERDPVFVGQGKTHWDPSEEWDGVCDAVFWWLHGDLMRELGLDDGKRVAAPPGAADAVAQLAPLIRTSVARSRELEREASEKEDVIGVLKGELDVQARAARERLALIEELTSGERTQTMALDEILVQSEQSLIQ